MLLALTNEQRGSRFRGRLRDLGRLLAQIAVYQRPGMPVEHVPPVTDRSSRLHRPDDPLP